MFGFPFIKTALRELLKIVLIALAILLLAMFSLTFSLEYEFKVLEMLDFRLDF